MENRVTLLVWFLYFSCHVICDACQYFIL